MNLPFARGRQGRFRIIQECSMKKCPMLRLALFALLFVLLPASSLAAEPQKNPPAYANSIGMEFVLIPAGSFQVATRKDEFGENVFGEAIISKPFYLGKYPVTQEQWLAVMGNNPAFFKGRRHPVEMVSWDDVQEFIKRLNSKEGHKRYRLPTEMEWEFAARGGTRTKYFFMKDPKKWEEAEGPLADYAWCRGNAGDVTHPVGQKKPNPYGLYDVYGNVFEWVQDWYAKELPASREFTDYRGPATGESRVNRGGSWYYEAEYCRSDKRDYDTPDYRDSDLGFRLALSLE